MRNRTVSVLATALVTGAILLTGCSGGSKPAAKTATADPKPTLSVPKSFASEQARREFVQVALNGDYYVEAEPLLTSMIQSASSDPWVYVQLGKTKYMLNRWDEAVQAWTKASELAPGLTGEMQNNIGNAHRDNRKPELAKAAYKAALEAEPTRWSAAVNLADVLRGEGNVKEAIQVLEAAAKQNPGEVTLADMANSLKSQETQVN